jgi:hypothetical protein
VEKAVNLWYDAEADFLEIVLERAPGDYRETSDDRVMEKVAEDGRLLAFSVMGLRSLGPKEFLNMHLAGDVREHAVTGSRDA